MSTLRRWALGLLLTAATPAWAQDTPWSARPSCREAVDAMMAPDPSAEAKLSKLERSADPDDQACAAWARASGAEFQLSMYGPTPEHTQARKRALSRLYGFAKANKARGARFGDLELEARLRRIRVLNEEGQRTQALEDLKQLEKLLAERGSADHTPTLDYAVGVLNAALSSPGWAARALLSVAGMSTDPAVAAARLHRLIDGGTVYAADAAYVAKFFGQSIGTKDFRSTEAYVRPLVTRYPNNPLFVFEAAQLDAAGGRAKEAQALLAPLMTTLDAAPASWGPPARARLLWVAGRVALAQGDRPLAQRRAKQARAERVKELAERIEDLEDDLDD